MVRHTEPDYNNHDDVPRELSYEALHDRKLETKFLLDKGINIVLSRSYKRAIDTVADFAETVNLEFETVDNYRERKVDNGWLSLTLFVRNNGMISIMNCLMEKL